jgi:hypothetical protein
MIATEEIRRVIGGDVYDSSGRTIGPASEVYLDRQTGRPKWVAIRTGLFGTKESFAPIQHARLTDDGLCVPVSKEAVEEAPRNDTDGYLTVQEEEALYRHYAM